MSEWMQLTPEDKLRPDEDTVCYQHDSNNQFPHHLVVECNDMMLTSAEALAFARQLPEVQALVEAIGRICRYAKADHYCDIQDGSVAPVFDEETLDSLYAAYAPFEEVK
jgi:hypothetical protein